MAYNAYAVRVGVGDRVGIHSQAPSAGIYTPGVRHSRLLTSDIWALFGDIALVAYLSTAWHHRNTQLNRLCSQTFLPTQTTLLDTRPFPRNRLFCTQILQHNGLLLPQLYHRLCHHLQRNRLLCTHVPCDATDSRGHTSLATGTTLVHADLATQPTLAATACGAGTTAARQRHFSSVSYDGQSIYTVVLSCTNRAYANDSRFPDRLGKWLCVTLKSAGVV